MREIHQRVGSFPTIPTASIDFQPDRPLNRHLRISPYVRTSRSRLDEQGCTEYGSLDMP